MRRSSNHNANALAPEEMELLTCAFRAGDLGAFRKLYDMYNAAVYRFCRHMMADEAAAKDVFQETFLRFYEHRSQLLGSNVRSWLFVIARRTCLNALRSRRAAHEEFDEGAFVCSQDTVSDVGLRDQIEKALTALPPALKEALILREVEGYTYEEIASICGIDLSLAKVRVHRARITMRKLLAPIVHQVYR